MPSFRNIFKQIPIRKPKRNIFDLSFDNLLTVNFGELVPVLCKEVLPGDTWQVQSSTLIRFAPMLAPIMHRVNCYIHYFFVPNRLVWSEWEDFITGGPDGQSSPNLPFVELTFGDATSKYFRSKSLWDYLGLPTFTNDTDEANWADQFISEGGRINALPFAAYAKIWNDFYRDQNLQEEIDIKTIIDAGSIDPTDQMDVELLKLRKRAWEKDYFTSALPWPQRGGDVHLPLTGDAEVTGDVLLDTDHVQEEALARPFLISPQGSLSSVRSERIMRVQGTSSDGGYFDGGTTSADDSGPLVIDPNHTLKVEGSADLSTVSSATINELRRAMRLQEWLEKNARSGARYIEQIFSHFGVRSSDARLDRAEYLGGGKCPISISEVLQTSETTSESPLADMAGHGLGTGNSNKFRKFFEEHGYVFGIMSFIPRSSYSGGIPRHFIKKDKFDYAWPEFANLGEQEIHQCELNANSNSNFNVFGYTPRYAEYKFSLNEFHGDFRNSLDFWHLGRKFAVDDTVPLNEDFIAVDQDNDDLNRIFAVTDSSESHILVECYNSITVKRTLPKFGVPTL